MRIISAVIFCSTLLFWGCVKDKPPVQTTTPVVISGKGHVFVVSEGNYGSANATLGAWDATTNSFAEDVYKANNGSTCGDVLQSVTKVGANYYLVVNNSAKILVCDGSLKKTGEVNGLTSPRYLQAVSPAKAYVSDLYANAISIVDLNSNTISGKIACKGWTERMVMLYNKVFVTNVSSAYLYVINTITDKLEDSVLVGENAAGIVADKEAFVWVLLRAKTAKEASKLVRIDGVNNKITKELTINGSASDLQINAQGNALFFINSGIQKLAIGNETPVQIVNGNGTYYGLGIAPNNGNLYLSDAKDYTQRSVVEVYDADGTFVTSFKAGVNCNGFYFE